MQNKAIKNDYEMNVEIAEKIISIIESGNVQEWRRTWTTTSGLNKTNIYDLVIEGMLAINVYTLQEYNPLLVKPGFYVTFKQIKEKKLHLNKGAKGEANYKPCSFYKHLTAVELEALNKEIEDKEELKEEIEKLLNGDIYRVKVSFEYIDAKGNKRLFSEELELDKQTKQFKYRKFQYVLEYLFKAEDCNLDVKALLGVKDEEPEDTKTTELKKIKRVEDVKNSYIQRAKLTYREEPQNKAYYMPGNHSVTLPTQRQFETIEDYYQTMLHEFAHSTGHYSLLNRATLTGNCGFGSVTYSKEELVAELSSLYSMISLNLINDDILKNSIAYLKSWGKGLKEGIKYNIMNTISHSRKATNLILNIQENRKEAQ